ncbi:non-hydrolyzing UDP-N-acetylglucosamine 2-epimerase [Yoonia sp.]|uniref:non-hydrolyzing UDP-N-acetylglucosamine 2-epimerase n=1 Tax=Yoonia sp. TaxID=2212373 RepID=UPI0035C7CE17
MAQSQQDRPIWIISGTRPEVIKLAPVLRSLQHQFGNEAVHWISTGQHMQLESETLALFGITPHHRQPRRPEDKHIVDFDAHLIEGLTQLMRTEKPRLIVVQGDTASTFSGAFAGFHEGIPVAHVEAGLRSDSIHDPFPEESYRRMTDAMTVLHFAPSVLAVQNLQSEGYPADTIYCTGNTSIDALGMVDELQARASPDDPPLPPMAADRRLMMVTVHRRESWGAPMQDICLAIRDIVRRYDDLEVILPMHVNPKVRSTVLGVLEGEPRVHLTEPMAFAQFHAVMRRAHLILSDSGGISEEAPSYGVPTLILRNTTERPEAIKAGLALLAGTSRAAVFAAASRILDDPREHQAMQGGQNPYGDGRAAERIALGIARYLDGQQPALTKVEQFC